MPDFEIKISLPVQSNSISEVAKATAPFIAELEALKQKLPENATYKDGLTGLRAGASGPRKSRADYIKEAVEADRATRAADVVGDPAAPSNGPRVPRGVHAA